MNNEKHLLAFQLYLVIFTEDATESREELEKNMPAYRFANKYMNDPEADELLRENVALAFSQVQPFEGIGNPDGVQNSYFLIHYTDPTYKVIEKAVSAGLAYYFFDIDKDPAMSTQKSYLKHALKEAHYKAGLQDWLEEIQERGQHGALFEIVAHMIDIYERADRMKKEAKNAPEPIRVRPDPLELIETSTGKEATRLMLPCPAPSAPDWIVLSKDEYIKQIASEWDTPAPVLSEVAVKFPEDPEALVRAMKLHNFGTAPFDAVEMKMFAAEAFIYSNFGEGDYTYFDLASILRIPPTNDNLTMLASYHGWRAKYPVTRRLVVQDKRTGEAHYLLPSEFGQGDGHWNAGQREKELHASSGFNPHGVTEWGMLREFQGKPMLCFHLGGCPALIEIAKEHGWIKTIPMAAFSAVGSSQKEMLELILQSFIAFKAGSSKYDFSKCLIKPVNDCLEMKGNKEKANPARLVRYTREILEKKIKEGEIFTGWVYVGKSGKRNNYSTAKLYLFRSKTAFEKWKKGRSDLQIKREMPEEIAVSKTNRKKYKVKKDPER